MLYAYTSYTSVTHTSMGCTFLIQVCCYVCSQQQPAHTATAAPTNRVQLHWCVHSIAHKQSAKKLCQVWQNSSRQADGLSEHKEWLAVVQDTGFYLFSLLNVAGHQPLILFTAALQSLQLHSSMPPQHTSTERHDPHAVLSGCAHDIHSQA